MRGSERLDRFVEALLRDKQFLVGGKCVVVSNGAQRIVLERHPGSWAEEDAIPERSPWFRLGASASRLSAQWSFAAATVEYEAD